MSSNRPNPIWFCVLGLAVLGLAACDSAPSSRSSVLSSSTKTRSYRLSRETLADVGLREYWYRDPSAPSEFDVGTDNAFLLDEGLLIVARPRTNGGTRYLKFLKREDGEAQWYEKIDDNIVNAPSTYVYRSAGEGPTKPPELFFTLLDTVHCLDLRHGDEMWHQQFKFPVSSAMRANETHLFVGSENHRIYGVRKGAPIDDWTHLTGERVTASPALTRAGVVFASNDGSVYGMNSDQGWVHRESWTLETGSRIVADPTAYGRFVFVGSTDYKLYCVDAADGSVQWSYVAQAPILDQPVVYNVRANREFAFCISTEGNGRKATKNLVALELPKGKYVPRGQAVWRAEKIRKIISLGRETIYAIEDNKSGDDVIVGLDVFTGKRKFRLVVNGFHFLPTNFADGGRDAAERGKIYLISRNGSIQCIGEKY